MDKILVVDDEDNMLNLFKKMLKEEPVEIDLVSNGKEALRRIEEQSYDLILSDLNMPDINGLELLRRSREIHEDTPFIVITGYGTIESAVYAIQQGAHHYITKPFQRDATIFIIQHALKQAKMSKELKGLRQEVLKKYSFENIIAKSKKMRDLFRMVEQVADSNATVLISGESGTGKEMFAKALHYHSNRKTKPFVAINCSVLPENLLESELFGHLKGSFTGATYDKQGLFLEADQGTIFLDELGEISLSMQTKLLRALQEREVKPLGSNKNIKFNAKVVVATNQNLENQIVTGAFRKDLYYRIAVIPIRIPPLRERPEDIPLLLNHFLKKYCDENHKPLLKISPRVSQRLMSYTWPGNVRELEHLVERAVLICDSETINEIHLPEYLKSEPLPTSHIEDFNSLKEVIDKTICIVEKECILNALQRTAYNRSNAAKLLKISRGSLYNKMKRYHIPSSPN